MPSQLTREVFRRLLASEPIVHRGCLRRHSYRNAPLALGRRGTSNPHNGPVFPRHDQRRSFFNFSLFKRSGRELIDPSMLPGMEKMMELEKMQRMRTRLPSPEAVAEAFAQFVDAKFRSSRYVEDNEAALSLRSLRYIYSDQLAGIPGTGGRPLVSSTTFDRAAQILLRRPEKVSPAHLEWAEFSFTHSKAFNLQSRDLLLDWEKSFNEEIAKTEPTTNPTPDLEEVYSYEVANGSQKLNRVTPFRGHFIDAWSSLLMNFAELKDSAGVQQTLQLLYDRGLAKDSVIQRTMIKLSIDQGNTDDIRRFWNQWRHSKAEICASSKDVSKFVDEDTETIQILLKWCICARNFEFGHEIVKEITQKNPPKGFWDAIFVWAAATGKGVDEINRMFTVMEHSNAAIADESEWRRPDTTTINALVEFAISKKDPYQAERFISLGRERGIEPNARTYVLQMDYRLDVGDTDGALIAYKNLQDLDVSSDEHVATVNKLIVSLCSSKRHDFDTIMNVAADLSNRKSRFEPLTVSTLALLHLDRDEIHDVIDLLNTHAFHFSSAERVAICDRLVSYCLEPETPTSRAWDTYIIIHRIFDELSRESRTNLMSSFFKRERPDMAVHVFNHMRAHSHAAIIPTVDTYVTAFLGCAKLNDIESLEVLHNQLKLDYNIDINTYLRNALIIAYTACEKPFKGLTFWDDIVASREGPSYNSVHIAMRACERAYLGDLKAKEIWNKLRKMNIELDGTMWASYVAAIAGNGNVRAAIRILEVAEENGEVEVDEFVVGSLFMAAPGMLKQSEVEKWAKETHPEIWDKLEQKGMQQGPGGQRLVDVDRRVMP
ncbi:hypothetical protein M433DRAFT_63732 [Acidomyces richmondensis BFW]|nr:MAG: hypothetical protein FE78DRAFT_143349 [Acidomyces sp. 'richmondensis']KYG47128.1 hypothetical protein M433DRAFT_63732 [Acidomyces richmondensis BFW]